MRQLQRVILSLFILVAAPGINQVAAQQAEDVTPVQHYLKLEPPFVVNIADGEVIRFLQVNTELQFSNQLAQPILEKHLPAIRHAMVMLLSDQPANTIKTAKGKQDLTIAALQEVQKIMTDNTGKPVIEAVYFTGFIIQ